MSCEFRISWQLKRKGPNPELFWKSYHIEINTKTGHITDTQNTPGDQSVFQILVKAEHHQVKKYKIYSLF